MPRERQRLSVERLTLSNAATSLVVSKAVMLLSPTLSLMINFLSGRWNRWRAG
jgi:hypothetical protein